MSNGGQVHTVRGQLKRHIPFPQPHTQATVDGVGFKGSMFSLNCFSAATALGSDFVAVLVRRRRCELMDG